MRVNGGCLVYTGVKKLFLFFWKERFSFWISIWNIRCWSCTWASCTTRVSLNKLKIDPWSLGRHIDRIETDNNPLTCLNGRAVQDHGTIQSTSLTRKITFHLPVITLFMILSWDFRCVCQEMLVSTTNASSIGTGLAKFWSNTVLLLNIISWPSRHA
jgi:hypothetical protein